MRPKHRLGRLVASLVATLAVAACATSIGPRTITPARFDYNQRIVHSTDEQILLNLVRLRYRDTPFFLDIEAVLVQYEIDKKATLSGTRGYRGGASSITPGIELDAEERPTITYHPLLGDNFAQRLLSPIPISTLALLAGSGWSVERVLDCCVDAVNDLINVPAAAGPTPASIRVDPRFHELAKLLRSLQTAGVLQFGRALDGSDSGTVRLTVGDSLTPAAVSGARARVRELLHLHGETNELGVTASEARSSAPIRVRQRSLLGAMFFLSQVVEVPESDARAGLVTRAVDSQGQPVDWTAVTGGIFHVHVADARPERAFTVVPYRGHWFYIDDADLESKTTFGLLSHLFSLQSAPPRGEAPLVTVPIGH